MRDAARAASSDGAGPTAGRGIRFARAPAAQARLGSGSAPPARSLPPPRWRGSRGDVFSAGA
jgi:hypothetical protein